MLRGYKGIAGQPVKPYIEFSSYIGSDIWLNLTFLDRDKKLATPASASYRIDNLTTDDIVLDNTAFPTPLASEMALHIPASINTIGTSIGQTSQINQVTVTAIFADGSQNKSVHIYELIAIETIGGN